MAKGKEIVKAAPAGKITGIVSKDAPLHAPRKLDIACGNNKSKGFKGIDISPDSQAEIIHDLFDYPWPIKANSVQEAFCSHFAEHIPHEDAKGRWPIGVDGWFMFFDELHRVLKKGGTATFIHPYVMSGRAFYDPTHVRFIHEATWYYLDPEWRASQQLGHYPTKANFELISVNGMGLTDEFNSRSPEQQDFQRRHYWNVVQDLQVIIKKR